MEHTKAYFRMHLSKWSTNKVLFVELWWVTDRILHPPLGRSPFLRYFSFSCHSIAYTHQGNALHQSKALFAHQNTDSPNEREIKMTINASPKQTSRHTSTEELEMFPQSTPKDKGPKYSFPNSPPNKSPSLASVLKTLVHAHCALNTPRSGCTLSTQCSGKPAIPLPRQYRLGP